VAVVAKGTDQLQVLVGVPVSDTTLQPDEHGGSIPAASGNSRGNRQEPVDSWHHISSAIEGPIQQSRAFPPNPARRKARNCRK
jgi:hypothetical protein